MAFFSKKVSLLTSMVVGAVTALLAFVAIIFADTLFSMSQGYFGTPWEMEAIAVGNGYSISIVAKHIHPYLAEYDQFVRIYGGEPREGDLLGEVQIETNTGGRVRIGVFVPNEPSDTEIILLQRLFLTGVRLDEQKVIKHRAWIPEFSVDDLPDGRSFTFLGWVSASSYPMKFIPCQVWPTLSPEERDAIVGSDKGLDALC